MLLPFVQLLRISNATESITLIAINCDPPINDTASAFSFFTFFIAGLFVCTEPGAKHQLDKGDHGFFHFAFTRLSRKQWLQFLYGQG